MATVDIGLLDQLQITEEEFLIVEDILNARRGDMPRIKGLTAAQTKFVRTIKAGAGTVVSHETLADACAHDPLKPPEPKIASVYMCRLRKAHPWIAANIATVWGEGFKWTGGGCDVDADL